MFKYNPAPLLKVHKIADFLKSQEHFPPILEVGPRTVELWMTALDLNVSRNNISKRAPEVLQILRDTAQPPVSREQCQAYQRGTDDRPSRQNLAPPRLSSRPVPGSLRSATFLPKATTNNAATESSSEAVARDPQDQESETLTREFQRQEYLQSGSGDEISNSDDEEEDEAPKVSKSSGKKRKADTASGSDAEEEGVLLKKVKKSKEEKLAKTARKAFKAKEEEERKFKEAEERLAKKKERLAKKEERLVRRGGRLAKKEEKLAKKDEKKKAKKEEKKQAKKEKKEARKTEKVRSAEKAERDSWFDNPTEPEWHHFSDDEDSSDAVDVEDLQDPPSPQPQKAK